MKPLILTANALWYASNLPAWRAFRHAVHRPQEAQDKVFRQAMGRVSHTAFGKEHGLTAETSYEAFCDRVPLRRYEDFEPWIARIRDGERNVLTPHPVRRLVTTSGTTAGRKLIPHTQALQAEFNRAIGPWIVDLIHTRPTLLAGPAYWSISPAAQKAPSEPSAVPIGFEDDGEYLGSLRRHLVDAVMAVPNSVRHADNIDQWRRLTLQYLRAADDLRLVSVWHPSFLDLLLNGIERPHELWPKLAVISCWTDAHAALPAETLAARFPGVLVQPKGLLATEGVVSIPFAGKRPLAVRSHFLEFIDEQERVRRVHELEQGETYEVVLTTGGGLYRYRLGDLVRVDGFVGRTPSVRFLGKAGLVSDRFGEKLAEPFVGQVLAELRQFAGKTWRFAMLAVDGARYRLFLDGDDWPALAGDLDDALRANPHYAYCRDLGQLRPCVVTRVRDGQAAFFRRMIAFGQVAGDIKPVALSPLDDWPAWFTPAAFAG